MSTPSLLLGRSMMWPTEAFTVKSLPRYFPMVFALAGDSTTTSDFIGQPSGAFFREVTAHHWGGATLEKTRGDQRSLMLSPSFLPVERSIRFPKEILSRQLFDQPPQ